MTSDSRNLGIRNEFERITSSGVFSDRSVIIVDLSGSCLKSDVFNNCSKFDSIIDFRLFLLAQSNAFGITSTFNVPDTFISPDMLIISN